MAQRRRQRPAEFKARVALAPRGDKTVNELAAQFQVHAHQITARLPNRSPAKILGPRNFRDGIHLLDRVAVALVAVLIFEGIVVAIGGDEEGHVSCRTASCPARRLGCT